MLREGTGFSKAYIAVGFTDMRLGIDSLALLIQESLDPVTAPAAEQEQYIPFKRVHLITAFDDLRQSGDPFSKISIATDHDELLYAVCFIKHGTPP